MVFAEVSVVPGILEVALAQKGALVRIFRHAISLFTVISAASRYLALLKQEIYRLCGSFRAPPPFSKPVRLVVSWDRRFLVRRDRFGIRGLRRRKNRGEI